MAATFFFEKKKQFEKFLIFFSFFFGKVDVIPKEGWTFGMTTAQDNRDLFASFGTIV